MLNGWKWKTMRVSILVSLVNLRSLAMLQLCSDAALWQAASWAYRGCMQCGLVDLVHSGFNQGRRCRQGHVFVLCKFKHMRSGEGQWAVWPRSSRRTGWVMEMESQVSVSLPGERVSWLWPWLHSHHRPVVSLCLHQTVAILRDSELARSRGEVNIGMRLPVCLTYNWCVCVLWKQTHFRGFHHAKKRRSSEPSRELKDPEYADKDETAGVCILYIVRVCEGGCARDECKYRFGKQAGVTCVYNIDMSIL